MIQTPLAGPGQTDSVAEQRMQAELWLNMLKGTQEAQGWRYLQQQMQWMYDRSTYISGHFKGVM